MSRVIHKTNPSWQIWIDTGGTFTDCMATSPTGAFTRLKILSSSVLRGKIVRTENDHVLKVEMIWPVTIDIFRGFDLHVIGTTTKRKIERINLIQNLIHLQQPLKKRFNNFTFEITSNEEVPVLAARLLTATPLGKAFPSINMKLGSTRGTNAILERKGAKTAFLVTKGFKDLLLIGNQQRPDLFVLHIIKPKPLYESVLEVDERIESDGSVLHELETSNIRTILSTLKKKKITSV